MSKVKEQASGVTDVSSDDVKKVGNDGGDTNETNEANNDDYDEEEDDDYDPTAKAEDEVVSESDDDKDVPDYSGIGSGTTQVRTRHQRYQEGEGGQKKGGNIVGEVSNIDFDSIFKDLKQKSAEGKPSDWKEIYGDEDEGVDKDDEKKVDPKEKDVVTDEQTKITINTSYTFAGRVITESKEVDIDSAEAKAFMNSTAGLRMQKGMPQSNKSFVPVIRTVPGFESPIELKIKLKRPSLIDKFNNTQGNKFQKLSTLEKSRLDWASFVDQNKINDELKSHNKDGYLEKQDFLGRVAAKQDQHYESAKEADRIKRWQDQQKQA